MIKKTCAITTILCLSLTACGKPTSTNVYLPPAIALSFEQQEKLRAFDPLFYTQFEKQQMALRIENQAILNVKKKNTSYRDVRQERLMQNLDDYLRYNIR